MSHEIFLSPEPFDAEAIRAWFAARGRYTFDGNVIRYANDDTDLAFVLQIMDRPAASDPHVWITADYLAPHTLALEIAGEVEAFLSQFGGVAKDAQVVGDAPFSREAMLKAWDEAARECFSSITPPGGDDRLFAADAALIDAVWDWNANRAAMQAAAGNSVFVPKVCWVRPGAGDDVFACVTWNWGIPTVIPENLVTRLVLVRQPKPGLMQMFSRQKAQEARPELKLINVESGIRLRGLEPCRFQGRDVLLAPPTGTLEVQTLFLGSWPKANFSTIPQNRVCGAEFIDLLENR
ncbi:MAG: hypothetical protein R3C46_14790 [Hyphomonadaceae bacterium]